MPVRGGTLLAVFTLRCISANTWVQPALWNTHWNNDAFLIVRNVPLKRCVEECQVRDRCKAVNYWRVRRNCELMDDDVTTLLEPGGGHPCLAITKIDMGQPGECKNCDRVCGADSDSSTCLRKECLPPVVDHGHSLGNMLSVGDTRKIICNEFYKPEAGADRVKCQDDGKWDPTVSCVLNVLCGTPPLVTNALAGEISGHVIPGTVVVYSCAADYVASPVNSALSLTCMASMDWTSVDFECLKVCGTPPLVTNALAGEISGHVIPGTVVVYSCAADYVASPVNSALSLTCMASMDWTSVDFECLKDCGTPPLVENAMAGAISGLAFPGTEVVYSCDPGYVASPETSDLRLTCQISGQWTHEHFECLRDCGTPPLVPNALPGEISGHAIPGTVVVYSCNTGHVASPENSDLSVSCQPSGEWTSVHFNCYRDCVAGWRQFEGSFYCISTEGLTFYQAQEYCKEHGANLVHVDDSLENDFILSMIQTEDSSLSFWLGLTDEAVEGEWRWVDNNDTMTFSDWAMDEPNDSLGEDCGCLWGDHQLKWNDITCTWEGVRAICEKV